MCIVLFGCIWDRLVAILNSVQNGLQWCKSSCHEVVLEVFAMNAPDPPFWTITSCFGAFHTIWVHLFCPTTLSAKRVNWCNCSCHKVALEFFAMNAPDPPHWTLNFCFRAICTILVHLGLFGCLIKLGAERAEVVQKFMPRSRIGIFRD